MDLSTIGTNSFPPSSLSFRVRVQFSQNSIQAFINDGTEIRPVNNIDILNNVDLSTFVLIKQDTLLITVQQVGLYYTAVNDINRTLIG